MCGATLTSPPDDAGESFNLVVMGDMIDGPAWESSFILYPYNVTTVSNDSAVNR